jgi:hypothetical protein
MDAFDSLDFTSAQLELHRISTTNDVPVDGQADGVGCIIASDVPARLGPKATALAWH